MASFKLRHPAVIKYTCKDLEEKVKSIIEQMCAAKHKGMTVMFYSGIIGSIPGCIKEMKIAIDVRKKHPEMQITGPAKEKFIRRSEYGVGMLYDQRLIDICQG